MWLYVIMIFIVPKCDRQQPPKKIEPVGVSGKYRWEASSSPISGSGTYCSIFLGVGMILWGFLWDIDLRMGIEHDKTTWMLQVDSGPQFEVLFLRAGFDGIGNCCDTCPQGYPTSWACIHPQQALRWYFCGFPRFFCIKDPYKVMPPQVQDVIRCYRCVCMPQ